MPALQKATLTKAEIKRYLGVGEVRFKNLLNNTDFPKQKPIIEKWVKSEIDRWLESYSSQNKIEEPKEWSDFIGA